MVHYKDEGSMDDGLERGHLDGELTIALYVLEIWNIACV